MRQPGPPPTRGELQRSTPWVWLWCERCQHHAPLACAVAVILWGPDASSDKLRTGARCTRCGRKGASLQRPGWAGNHIGLYPFPAACLYYAADFSWINPRRAKCTASTNSAAVKRELKLSRATTRSRNTPRFSVGSLPAAVMTAANWSSLTASIESNPERISCGSTDGLPPALDVNG
jgi:hypothetical protein